jgi:eukaryotic-like serine/threonine-protein kinase
VKTTREQDLGSSLYMAPEYMQQRRAEPRSDVYSMGLILYEILAGAHPIASTNAMEICLRQMTETPPPLASLHDVPGDLSDLVQRALSKQPARRGSMRELADALAVVLGHLLVKRRAVARSLPLPNRDAATAATVQAMAAFAAGGTIPMPAHANRDASNPPAPMAAFPDPAIALGSPPSPVPSAPLPAGTRVPVTVAMEEVGAAGERRSTGAPVERPATRPSTAPRALPRALGVAGAVLALGLPAAGWLLIGRGGGATASTQPPPAPAAASATAATASAGAGPAPAGSSSGAGATRPKAPAAPARNRPAPQRPRLPFP